MGSTLSYAGLQRNDFDSTLGGQVFRGVEPPRTGGGKFHLFTKSYIYFVVIERRYTRFTIYFLIHRTATGYARRPFQQQICSSG